MLNRQRLKNVYQYAEVSFHLGEKKIFHLVKVKWEDFLSIVFHGYVFPCTFPLVLCHFFLYFPIIFFVTFFHAF